MTTSGNVAYLTFEDKLIQWDLAAGRVQDSIVLFNTSTYATSYPSAKKMWINDRFIVVETSNNDVQVFDKASRASLYRTQGMTGSVQVDFATNRLFNTDGDFLDVYELSTGKKLESIIAPCEQFSGNLAVWTNPQGAVQVAAAGQHGGMYRYAVTR